MIHLFISMSVFVIVLQSPARSVALIQAHETLSRIHASRWIGPLGRRMVA